MDERIEQLHCVAVFDRVATLLLVSGIVHLVGIHRLNPVGFMGVLRNNVQYFDFIIGRLSIVRCAFLDFHGHVGVVHRVTSKPDCREMAPSEFLNGDIAIDHDFTDMHRMVASNLVVSYSFVLTLVTVCVQLSLANIVLKCSGRLCVLQFSLLLQILSLLRCRLLLILVLLSLFSLLFLLLLYCRVLYQTGIFVGAFHLLVLVLAPTDLILVVRLSCRVEPTWPTGAPISST